MEDTNFYTYKNGQKFEQCKSCLTMHIDNFDESTYLWILEKADVPYIPQEWNVLRDRAYAKNPKKMNGMSVVGKYLSKMKLKQWKNYSWADTQKLQDEANKRSAAQQQQNKIEQEQVRQQFQRGQISQAQYRTLVDTQYQKQNQSMFSANPIGDNNMFNESDYIPQSQLPDIGAELTKQDKIYLAMKWGRTYKPSEWVELEKRYTEMMNSFDIQDADSKNTLILICKTNLKQNQALDMGDYQGYKKLSSVSDSLRKSAKFTAAQNKEEKADFIDSVGQLVAYCQKNGGQIPRIDINTPRDIIDKIILDLKQYNKSLIESDTALSREIQDYIKNAKIAAAKKKDKKQAKQQGYDVPQLTEQDTLDFKQFLKTQKEQTEKEMEEQ